MFHLQSGIDLHEVEMAIGRDDELNRSCIGVVDCMGRLHRCSTHRRAQFRCQERRRRFLEDLLVAALCRTLALIEVDRIALRVAEHLDLDVARRLDVALQQYPVAAERALRLALAAFQVGQEFLQRVHDAHALAAAAVRGLDHQREADARGFACQHLRRLVVAGITRHYRHAGRVHEVLGAGLAAHLAHRRGLGTDEGDPGRFHGIGEVRVLAEEAVTGMDRLRAGRPRNLDDRVAAQVTLLRPRTTDRVRLIGKAHVLCVGIGRGEHGHRADAEPAAGANHAAGDFAAVGDEDLGEHLFLQSGAWQTASMLWPSGSSTNAP
jgi:hypothetical protein